MPNAERKTKQKQAVYEALCALDHPTATEVYGFVRAKNPTLSRGTVFRVLGGFADSGKAKRLCFAGSDVRYDPTLTPHAHARCRRCGRVFDVRLPCSSELLETAKSEAFEPDGFEVEFFGLCVFCKNTENLK